MCDSVEDFAPLSFAPEAARPPPTGSAEQHTQVHNRPSNPPTAQLTTADTRNGIPATTPAGCQSSHTNPTAPSANPATSAFQGESQPPARVGSDLDRIPTVHGPALIDDRADQIYDDWNGAAQFNRPDSPPSEFGEASTQGRADLPDASRPSTLHPIDQAESALLLAEGPQCGTAVQGLDAEGVHTLMNEGPHFMNVHQEESQRDHWPWKDRKHCTFDTLGAFPRSLFSESELEGVRWLADANGVHDLPSVKSVKRDRADITRIAGSRPQLFTSNSKNMFVMTNLATILQHELANPLIAQYLQTLPEDSGEILGEACQAERWRLEVDPNLACPMARSLDGKDYFVNEVAMALTKGGQPNSAALVMVRRWYRKAGEIFATVNPLLLSEDGQSLAVDEREECAVEVPLASFRLTVDELLAREATASDAQTAGRVPVTNQVPSPNSVVGALYSNDKPLRPWTEPTRNLWRTKANGLRVLSCPLWLYCDDTSGNTSKKWNKHNSLLFTLAGLPRSLVHLMYNIHYLATSNIAPPLEMMEQLVEQLCAARETGIRAWDVATQEYVLIVPWILAFLGDNPMSSEFASHIGMQGKCFCRTCQVKGADEKNRAPGQAGDKARLDEFLTPGKARTKEGTLADLREQFNRAMNGAPSGVDDLATQSGSKDKYFAHYVSKLQETVNGVRERHKTNPPTGGKSRSEDIQQALAEVRREMPDNLFNPTLRIPEFDPNRDTPFEALHCVLLGAVKYFWRDAVSRQTVDGKQMLKTRLDNVDTSGLGIPRLRGHTLVQYAGSLVGRDFRAILQVAPAVLYGLLPDESYEAWLALCRLAPLIFQPEIMDLTAYLVRLEDAIEDFLAATALWTTQWFNKPKFHLFVHLPSYVKRFGPAIIYATEGFESYNFLIRLRSVHSNRHAPSSDIGDAFAFLHAVRHLVSGGYVELEDPCTGIVSRRQAGDGVRRLVEDRTFRHLMGMDGVLEMDDIEGGVATLAKDSRTIFMGTHTARAGFAQIEQPDAVVLLCDRLQLRNGDVAQKSGWVLYNSPSANRQSVAPPPKCGRLVEILLRANSGELLGALVALGAVGLLPESPYRLPSVKETVPRKLEFVSLKDLCCVIHVFHNCAAHSCKLTKTKSVMQERQQTTMMTYDVVHTQPEDAILNLSQLTNASALAPFRPAVRYPDLERSQLLERAVSQRAQLIAAAEQKKSEQAQRKRKREANKLSKQAKAAAAPAIQNLSAAADRATVVTEAHDSGVQTDSRPVAVGISRKRGRQHEEQPAQEDAGHRRALEVEVDINGGGDGEESEGCHAFMPASSRGPGGD